MSNIFGANAAVINNSFAFQFCWNKFCKKKRLNKTKKLKKNDNFSKNKKTHFPKELFCVVRDFFVKDEKKNKMCQIHADFN